MTTEENKARLRKYYRENRARLLEYQREYYRTNHARVYYVDIKRKYSLTRAEYQRMLKAQRGRCAICNNPPEQKRLHVDHDHKTKAVRGLLCRKCNHALGLFKDDPSRLAAALQYIENGGTLLGNSQATN